MKTAEMIEKANHNQKLYFTSDLLYSKENGFHYSNGMKAEGKSFEFINDLLDIDNWKEVAPKKMTKAEIELRLGYPIEIVEEPPSSTLQYLTIGMV